MDKVGAMCNLFSFGVSASVPTLSRRKNLLLMIPVHYYLQRRTRENRQEKPFGESGTSHALQGKARVFLRKRLRAHIEFNEDLKAQEPRRSDEGCWKFNIKKGTTKHDVSDI